ncbi:MAG: hypothetical protein LUH10_02870 [Tannerellaceae bacterium]|nr:hypothetical protein [Tannerellaceae bacterium]
MKKINIVSVILFVYILTIAVWQWPGNEPNPDYVQYFFIIGLSLVLAVLVRFIQIKRMKMRQQWGDEYQNKKKNRNLKENK